MDTSVDLVLRTAKKTVTHEYTAVVDGKNYGKISIIFVNGVFGEAKYSFNSVYTRKEWEILAAINAEVKKIEEGLVQLT